MTNIANFILTIIRPRNDHLGQAFTAEYSPTMSTVCLENRTRLERYSQTEETTQITNLFLLGMESFFTIRTITDIIFMLPANITIRLTNILQLDLKGL